MQIARGLAAIALACGTVLACGPARADTFPMPRPRPPFEFGVMVGAKPIFVAADMMDTVTSCQIEIQKVAEVEPLALLNPVEGCGGEDMMRVKSVFLPDRRRIPLNPAPEISCKLARSLAAWLREDIAPTFTEPKFASLLNYESYECRPRNRQIGARLSEHGKGNALDIRAFIMADGSSIDPTDVNVARGLREKLRSQACGRFSTVLGPGSDGFHEKHLHVDVAQRRLSYSICQWAIRERPAPVKPNDTVAQGDKEKVAAAGAAGEGASPDDSADAPDGADDAAPAAPAPAAGTVPVPRARPSYLRRFERLRF